MPQKFSKGSWSSFFKELFQELAGGFSFVLGILSLFAYANTSIPAYFWIGILLLGAGKAALPSVERFRKEKFGLALPGWIRLIIFLACWIGVWFLVNEYARNAILR